MKSATVDGLKVERLDAEEATLKHERRGGDEGWIVRHGARKPASRWFSGNKYGGLANAEEEATDCKKKWDSEERGGLVVRAPLRMDGRVIRSTASLGRGSAGNSRSQCCSRVVPIAGWARLSGGDGKLRRNSNPTRAGTQAGEAAGAKISEVSVVKAEGLATDS